MWIFKKYHYCCIFLLASLFVFSWTIACSELKTTGVIYYISPDGIDTNPGTIEKPWKTIERANNMLKSGDTVILREGEYSGTIKPVNSGESEQKRITYMSYPGENVFIILGSGLIKGWHLDSGTPGMDAVYVKEWKDKYDIALIQDTFEKAGRRSIPWHVNRRYRDLKGTQPVIDGPGQCWLKENKMYFRTTDGRSPDQHELRTLSGLAIELSMRSYITVSGIKVRFAKTFAILNESSFCTIKNCDFRCGNGYFGVSVSNGKFIRIENNVIQGVGAFEGHKATALNIRDSQGCVIQGNDISYGAHDNVTVDDRGEHVFKAGIPNIIRRNWLHDSGGSNIIIKGTAGTLVEQNVITTSARKEIVSRNHHVPHAGLDVRENHNVIIRKNLSFENGGPNGNMTVGAKDCRIYHNVYYGGETTAHSFRTWQNSLEKEWSSGNIWKNNIFYARQRLSFIFSPGNFSSLGNLFTHNLIGSMADKCDGSFRDKKMKKTLVIENITFEKKFPSFFKNNTFTVPGFKDPSSLDFSLRHDSPAIDRGDFLTSTVCDGSGTVIAVKDAGYFFDGKKVPGEEGDIIQVGDQVVRILECDYEADKITIDKDISWKAGDSVSLPWKGKTPDLGAFETGMDIWDIPMKREGPYEAH